VIDPRTLPVRFSRLKKMGQSPAHYLHACQEGDDDIDTLALRLGRGVHAELFGQPYVHYEGRRAGKSWEAFEAEHADKPILNSRELGIALGVAGAVRDHVTASSLLFGDGIELEKRLDWDFAGRACRSTPDARGPAHLVDLKTTRCADPTRFGWQAESLAYHAQLSFYREAIRASGGQVDAVYIVAVESAPPFPVTVFRVTEQSLELGERMWRLWFERLRVCEDSNHWPGYTQAVVELDIAPRQFAADLEEEDEAA
jgi:PDDEXK-like uncharacterized protein DUF3799